MSTLHPTSVQEPHDPNPVPTQKVGDSSSSIIPLPSPAFLASLRPPPLPLWAEAPTSTALSASRLSLLLAHQGTSVAFKVARTSTQFGFSIARTFAGPILDGIGAVLDHSLGLNTGTGKRGPVGSVLRGGLEGAEMAALFGIQVGSTLTEKTLNTATSTVSYFESYYGNDEALRALTAFLKLVEREYTTSLPTDPYQEGGLSRWSTAQVVKAAATWGVLQSVTSEMDGQKFKDELTEIDLKSWGRKVGGGKPGDAQILWEVTEEEVLESGEEIIEASVTGGSTREAVDCGDGGAETEEERTREHLRRFSKLALGSYGGLGLLFFGVKIPSPTNSTTTPATPASDDTSSRISTTPLTPAALAKLSRQYDERSLSEAFGYRKKPIDDGGPSVHESDQLEVEVGGLEAGWTEESAVASDDGEEYGTPGMGSTFSMDGDGDEEQPVQMPGGLGGGLSWWGLLSGSHDTHVLESMGGLEPGATLATAAESHADEDELHERLAGEERKKLGELRRVRMAKKGRRPPRFFIITDHPNRSVLLCLRGTMSIDDIATDLACETLSFDETLYWDTEPLTPSSFASSTASGVKVPRNMEGLTSKSEEWVDLGKEGEETPKDGVRENEGRTYEVHGGMWEIASAMGSPDGPLTKAVAKALKKNPEYGLFLVGHSLGAGIASLLSIMWANPESCLTASKSGLPVGRKVKCYGFAPPCTTDAALSNKCRKLIHSIVYSSDAVSRFSLGHMRDVRSAAAWLCFANEQPEESCNNILSRLLAYQRGRLDGDPETKRNEGAWFQGLRNTLEANMHYSTLFPPGDVFWLVKPGDIQLPGDAESSTELGHRLFHVTGQVSTVFKQMLFTKTMLSSHLPHQYSQAIEKYL